MSSHRTVRTLALSALVGLFALSGCSFHYSSGSSSSRVANGGSGGKPVHRSSHSHDGGGKATQNRSTSGSGKPTQKSVADNTPKADDDDDDVPKADEPATRKKPVASGAERTKPAQRTKPAERTKPTAPTTTTVYENDNDDMIKAKTKPADPPASNNTLVAPN
jgi:hypothetical protein